MSLHFYPIYMVFVFKLSPNDQYVYDKLPNSSIEWPVMLLGHNTQRDLNITRLLYCSRLLHCSWRLKRGGRTFGYRDVLRFYSDNLNGFQFYSMMPQKHNNIMTPTQKHHSWVPYLNLFMMMSYNSLYGAARSHLFCVMRWNHECRACNKPSYAVIFRTSTNEIPDIYYSGWSFVLNMQKLENEPWKLGAAFAREATSRRIAGTMVEKVRMAQQNMAARAA